MSRAFSCCKLFNHSLLRMVAYAASRRAKGTRNGELLTYFSFYSSVKILLSQFKPAFAPIRIPNDFITSLIIKSF